MAAHTVLRDIQRQRIALRQEFNSVVKRLRRYRPIGSRLGEAWLSCNKFRLTVLTGSDVITVIDILSHEVERLMDQLHIRIRDFRQILLELLQSFLRVVP